MEWSAIAALQQNDQLQHAIGDTHISWQDTCVTRIEWSQLHQQNDLSCNNTSKIGWIHQGWHPMRATALQQRRNKSATSLQQVCTIAAYHCTYFGHTLVKLWLLHVNHSRDASMRPIHVSVYKFHFHLYVLCAYVYVHSWDLFKWVYTYSIFIYVFCEHKCTCAFVYVAVG